MRNAHTYMYVRKQIPSTAILQRAAIRRMVIRQNARLRAAHDYQRDIRLRSRINRRIRTIALVYSVFTTNTRLDPRLISGAHEANEWLVVTSTYIAIRRRAQSISRRSLSKDAFDHELIDAEKRSSQLQSASMICHMRARSVSPYNS